VPPHRRLPTTTDPAKVLSLEPDRELAKGGLSLQPRSDVFHSALEIVSDRSLEAHGFALSSVVVNARTGIPGSGFFDAAISRWQLPNAQKVHSRREGIDPDSSGYRMWTEQASRAIEHYSR
jgi:hypothetical protein